MLAIEAKSYDLFIVHAEADRAWVDGYLRHALGLDPARVLTPRDFRLGERIVAEFERGVTSSRFTLLVLSPAFLTDRWAEFGEGLVSFSAVDEGRNRLLALTLHSCQAPLHLRFRESLDCTDWTRWDEEAVRLRRHLDAPDPTIEAVPCPYPGMVPFRRQDARFFHGRDEEIQKLLTLIRHNHFLIVIGSSGSGKSSLVTAGLLPKLDDPRNFARGTWRVITMRPGATPIEELSRIIPGAPVDPARAISATLAAEPPAQRLLIVIDQFEELFSQVKDASTRDAFIGHLKALRADPHCTVIMTMRADFYGDLMNSPLWPIDRSQIVEVVPLRGESLRQAIVKPAEEAGVFLEEGLVERLLADAADEPGSLPMLQEALVLLWGTMSGRLLTRASYDTLGRDGRSGLAVAMATKADATLAALPPDQQRIARRIFLRLVQFGEGRPDTRRQLGVDDLRAESDAPGAFDDLLQQLITNRLLTPSPDEARGLRVDIAHEMLIIGWPSSREWVESRRNAEKTRRRLVAKAEEWVRLGRGESGLLDPAELAEADAWLTGPDAADLGIDVDVNGLADASRRALESQKRRRRRWMQLTIAGLSAALLFISSLAVWGEVKRREALTARSAALKSAAAATASAAKMMIEAGSTALINGHSFDAMHRFAGSLALLGGQPPGRDDVRQALGFLARETPRLELILETSGQTLIAAFSPDGSRVLTASVYNKANDIAARVWRADTGALVAELKGHAAGVRTIACSPDGARVVTGSDDGTARIWIADTGALVAEFKGHEGPVSSAVFSTDGTRILSTASDKDKPAWVWNAKTGGPLLDLNPHDGERINSAAFSPDGTRVVTASGKAARVWDVSQTIPSESDVLRGGAATIMLVGHSDLVSSTAFSPDGARVLTGSHDGTARVWRADTGAPLAQLKGHGGGVTSVAFSPDGTRIVTTADYKTLQIWRVDTGAPIAKTAGHEGDVIRSVAFSPDGARVLTAGGKTARVWRADTGALVAELKGHGHFVLSAAFSPDGSRVVTGSEDGTARVWRADVGTLVPKLGKEGTFATAVASSPDGTRVLTAWYDDDKGKTARVWRADTGALLAELKGHTEAVESAAFSPDGSRVVTGSDDGTARLWRADTGALVAELKGHAGTIRSTAFSPDGSRVVTGSDDGTARLWRADTGAPLAQLKGHAGIRLPQLKGYTGMRLTVFSPDGSRIVTASVYNKANDIAALVWMADTGALIAELKGHADYVYSAAFSPDGSRVATASGDGTARLWRADTGALLAQLKGHGRTVASVAFSPDGTRIVTASWDKTARVWRADTGAPIAELNAPGDWVDSAAFSPDGTRIVTTSLLDETARVWAADTGTLLAELKGHRWASALTKFNSSGDRILTFWSDTNEWVWRFDVLPGDVATFPLWVEVLTGTELKGGGVQPLSLDAWNQRKTILQAQRDKTPPEDWFKTPKRTTNNAPAPAK